MTGRTLSIRTPSSSGSSSAEDDQRNTAPTAAKSDGPARKAAASRKSGNDGKQNLQDNFLNFLRREKVPVTMFLVKGVKLQGIVTWFDNFCVLLRRDGQSQLVYKHAISTIMPSAPVQLYEPEADED